MIKPEALEVWKRWAGENLDVKAFTGKDLLAFVADRAELETKLKGALFVMEQVAKAENTLLLPLLKSIKGEQAKHGGPTVGAMHEAQKKDPKLKAALESFSDLRKCLESEGIATRGY